MSTKMANSPSTMPGAFNFNAASRDTVPPRLSGAKSHIFQPPRTPSASASSSLILTRSTASVMSISSAGDRSSKLGPKRTLEDYHEGNGVETPRNGYVMDSEDWSTRDETDGRTPGSPKPFVNTRYQLAGGMDTPSLAAQQVMDTQSQYGDLGYRKSLADTDRPSRIEMWGEHGDQNDYFGRDCNGRGRYSQGYNGSPRGEGWSKTAIQVAGAVVGKAWEFCKSSAAVFRGFQAGGGTRYQINPSETFEPVEQSIWEEKGEFRDRESTPLPGQYPIEELEYIPDYMDNPTPEHTPPRPSKRRQISANQESAVNGSEELAKNWVVVPPTITPSKAPVQPRLSRFSQPTASSNSRRSLASVARPASRAGFGTPVSARRPGLSTQNSRISHAGSPALNAGRGASYASPRSPANSASRIPRATGSPLRNSNAPPQESPAAKEAKRWAALKKKEEREADESIRRLDAQLKAMIREGKEALGTKIEVDIEDDVDVRSNSTRSRPGNSRKWAF